MQNYLFEITNTETGRKYCATIKANDGDNIADIIADYTRIGWRLSFIAAFSSEAAAIAKREQLNAIYELQGISQKKYLIEKGVIQE